MIISEILVPLLNANEPEARVVKVHAQEGQHVEKGTILFTIETTKAASEIESPRKGVFRLLVNQGDAVLVGEKLAVLTDTAEEKVNIQNRQTMDEKTDSGKTSFGSALRITKPAQSLAESLGIDLQTLPKGQLITEKFVREFKNIREEAEIEMPPGSNKHLLIFGGGGHAKTVMDMVRQAGEYTIAGIVDDNPSLVGNRVLGVSILGTRAILPQLKVGGIHLIANCVGGILDINVRVRIFDMLENYGFAFPSLFHPQAIIEASATISDGVQVFANAYIGSDAQLHPKCMINTSAVVSHDCEIGSYTHIAPGVLLAGHVHVGERSLVGMGVTSTIGIKIGSGVRIGNGAIILADVPDNAIIQAGRYWIGKAE